MKIYTLIIIVLTFVCCKDKPKNIEYTTPVNNQNSNINDYKNNEKYEIKISEKVFVYGTVNCTNRAHDFENVDGIIVEEVKYCSQIQEVQRTDISKFEEQFMNCYEFRSNPNPKISGLQVHKETFKILQFNSHQEALESIKINCDKSVIAL